MKITYLTPEADLVLITLGKGLLGGSGENPTVDHTYDDEDGDTFWS